MRLIHTADLHLDAPLRTTAQADAGVAARIARAARDVLAALVGCAIDDGHAGFLIAGDVFDTNAPEVQTVAFFAAQMRRLEQAGIPVFLIRGNHDFAAHPGQTIPLPGNVHIFPSGGGSAPLSPEGPGSAVMIHGVSYGAQAVPGSLLPAYPPPVPGRLNIGLLHSSLSGSAAHDTYAPCSVADLVAHGYDYWALGHIHGRTEHHRAPWVVMPGCPQGRHINEPGPRFATVIEIAGGRIAAVGEIPTSRVLFARTAVPVTAEDGLDTVHNALRSAVIRAAEGLRAPAESVILRLELTGPEAALSPLRPRLPLLQADVAGTAEETGCVLIERLALRPTGPAAGQASAGAVAEIVETMTALLDTPAGQAEAEQILNDVLGQWPQGKALPEDLPALARALGQEGISEIAALLSAENGAENGTGTGIGKP